MLDGTQLRDATWEKDVHRTHSPLWHQNALCTVSTETDRSLLLLNVESFPTAGGLGLLVSGSGLLLQRRN